ncbi:hypothetical protein LLEC1_03808 [Akanthomyces lecanii]|uniref:Zn(2)-C6 fungal-type domain-containing protein n=1 Tax=Cordyceps confragosa TaxID=2714763 RepID=A0A179IG04_CORDF|nr:hypothetical protein LLEC1_03808 [Akanthomyces lecanii]
MPDPDMAQFTGVFRAGKPNRVKRNRLPLSCVACQRRKSKCDKRQPCGACDKRGEGDGCRFGSATRSPGVARQEVHMKLSRLEEMIKGFAGAEGKGDDAAMIDPQEPAGPAPGQQQKQQQLQLQLTQKTNTNATPNFHVPPPSAPSCSGTSATQESSLPPASPASEQTARPYHGATAWSSVVTSIQDIQHMLQTDSDADSNPEADTAEEFDQLLGHTRTIGIDEVKNSLPSKHFTDRVISCYFNAKFHAVPFIHAHQFRRQYEAFWEDPASTGFLWISLLFSVLAAGALLAKAKLTNEPGLLQSIEEPAFYLGISARCLITGNYLECRPGSVEAMLQHAHSRNMQRQDEDRVLWALYGLAVRMAQLQGYHRDPSKLPLSVSPFEGEMRRRTWFMIQSAELLVALHSGLPPIIYESLSDTEHPINLLDEDFDEHTVVLPPARPPTDPTPILAYIAKSKLSVILRRVMLHALAVKRPTYEETVLLSDQLQAWHDAQPACLRIRSIRSTAFTDANYTIMHRIMLELMYRKCLCVLHRPYLTEHKEDPKYDRSRQICREAALAMLEMHIELDYEISVQGRMHEDRFMVSNLTLQHFLLASTVVCVDLSESHDLATAERQYCKSVLQRSHDVWAARSAYSSDARHATRILRAVLSKVDNSASTTLSSSLSLTPGHNTDTTAMMAPSSSAGMSSATASATTGLEPPLAAMNVDVKTAPPQRQPLASAKMAPAIPMSNCCTIQSQSLPHSHTQQQAHMQSHGLSHPLQSHQEVATATSQDMYYDLNTGDYMAMTTQPDAQFAATAGSFGQAVDLDTLLYGTEGVNWNSIDQFLRVENSNNEQGWSNILQGV